MSGGDTGKEYEGGTEADAENPDFSEYQSRCADEGYDGDCLYESLLCEQLDEPIHCQYKIRPAIAPSPIMANGPIFLKYKAANAAMQMMKLL